MAAIDTHTHDSNIRLYGLGGAVELHPATVSTSQFTLQGRKVDGCHGEALFVENNASVPDGEF